MKAPKCPYCKEDAKLIDSKEVYGRSYGMIWLCKPCNAYVGTHKNSPDHKPLGRLANAQLRQWKRIAHYHFDPLWKSGRMSRSGAYRKLSKMLDIPKEECHIGMFDVSTCQKVVSMLGGVS